MNEPLPDLYTADLDDAEVGALLDDIDAAATLLGVTLKGAATTHAGAEAADASRGPNLRERLLAAEGPRPHGIQLRYLHAGVVYVDTLLRRAEGWRLTRIAPPHAKPPG